ncbi:MAG: glycosyltransferase family 2 protein [Methylophilaceae bacterium]|uniref:glycosyltransferase family 2 protein n=1 Tax=Methylicorpusculum sp. TaxID=2713644 RepID=UPI002731FC7B|nr:glycosyltransferase family 2 protein [Methylicorpusculum sp.]MDP2178384.1 glycosyltransferase family 2 protein [Methylicorpusculum sp.]MDP3530782.1 glycosyltransferase family 2 protein [Methylicorpusculum sp.]MDZ4099320.1 glycosyltransferase family 2 protein [Methylophilaceae bacterium]
MKKLISVVVPAFNEEDVIELFHRRMGEIFDRLPQYRCEMIFVNDGSSDRTQQIVDSLAERDERVCVITLSRNFGKEAAMTAGLDMAEGDAVAIFDVDLQDPPELLPEFVAKWEAGYDVVYAKRTHRQGESWLKKATAAAFYRLMKKISKVAIPADTGDCRLMSRRVVQALGQLREHHRFMKGLFAWVGYPSVAVEYLRDPRAAGSTKFNYWKLWNFALEGITSFTIAPLKIATYVGSFFAVGAFVMGAWIILKTLIWGDVARGYPTLIVTVLFLGGIQLFFIGILGEYIGRIFGETKNRPLYVIDRYLPARIGLSAKDNLIHPLQGM